MKKTLVTGATGFIGYHLVTLLASKGYNLRLLVRDVPRAKKLFSDLSCEIVQGDIISKMDVDYAVQGCEIVYHCAGLPSFNPNNRRRIFETNIEGTRNICEASLNYGVEKLIYTSSAATIGKNYKGLSDENTPFNLWKISGPYKQSKVYAEKIVMAYFSRGLPVVIVNPTLPIGSHDRRPAPAGNMILNYLRQKTIYYINGGLNFIDVKDVAMGHYLAEKKGVLGERYILGSVNLSIEGFYQLLDKVCGNAKRKIEIPYWVSLIVGGAFSIFSKWRDGEPFPSFEGVRLANESMFYNVEKANRVLGLSCKPIENACIEAINYFRANFPKGVSV